MAGQHVTHGVLYRFIPNLDVYWEYDRDRPSPRAFRRRPGETDGLSMYIDGHTSVQRLELLQPTFGIYALNVASLSAEARLHVIYDPNDSLPEGRAHVFVTGVNRRVAEWIARDVAYRVKPPGLVASGLPIDVESEPDP